MRVSAVLWVIAIGFSGSSLPCVGKLTGAVRLF